MGTKFQKAKPQQARLKISMYGPPGSGKTFTTLLMAEGLAKMRGKRIAYVDTERGTDFYSLAVKEREAHPEAFDFDALYTKSLAEVDEAVRGLDPNEYGVVVLDSISHLWDAAMEAYQGKRTTIDTIPMHAWGAIKKPYKALLAYLIGSQFDVFILGRQKNLFETPAEGEMQKVGVAMRAEGETAYEPHICIRMEAQQSRKDSTHADYYAHVEKDRTGILAGRSIPNPSYQTIVPILPLLGEVQAPIEDEEERIAKDGELADKQTEKSKAKAEKSQLLFIDLQVTLMSAADLNKLAEAYAELKKQWRYLVEEHRNALGEIYKSRREALMAAAAPAEL